MSKEEKISKGIESIKNNLIYSIANPIFIKDNEHKWIMFNDSFCEMIDIPREELLGKSDYDFFPKEEADVFWEKDDVVLSTGQSNINEEVLTTKGGETRTILTSKVRIKDEFGNFYILGTITDITEKKFEEIQLERKNLQINAQKNAIQHAVADLHQHTEQNLRIISNLISGLSQRIAEEKSSEILNDLSKWLNSMILVHKFFSESVNIKRISLPEYIDRLSQRVPDLEEQVHLLVSGEPVILHMKDMVPIGLMVTELLEACKIAGRVNDARIEVTHTNTNLELQFASSYPIITKEDIEDNEFGLYDLLVILAGQINGKITYSKDLTKIYLNIENIQLLKRGIFD